jgi:hypothetical protein
MNPTMKRVAIFVGMSLTVAFGVLGVALESSAQGPTSNPTQTRGGGRGAVQHRPSRAVDAAAAEQGGEAGSSLPSTAPAQGVIGQGPQAEQKTVDAGMVEIRKFGDGGQAMRFSELDIEGRLRSPQLIYFLRRVRAEFAAGDLGHRTFMRELSETRKDPSF